jgi:polysaccharide export outer membrane protein
MFQQTRHSSCKNLRLLIFFAFGLPVCAQTSPVTADSTAANPVAPASTTPASRTPISTTAKLTAGDLVEFSVYGVPDLNTKARIGNGGDVYLPLIDYVHIADLTVDEAQDLIQKRLEDGGFVRNAHVSIFVTESTSQAVNMMGEISHPGAYPVIGERRLYDLISAAGGLTDKSGRNVTIIHRQNPDQKVELELPSSLGDGNENTNVQIAPGDTIIVSRAGIVYVVGDVARPSGFMIEDKSLTVLKALALAGGGTRTASLNGAKILRQTPDGVKEIPVHLQKVLRAKSPDVALLKGDVLFVPGSAGKALAYRGAEAAFSMTSALAIIAIRP